MTTQSLTWFVARTRRGHELALRKRLGELGVESFIPSRFEFRERRGRRVRVEVPAISNMVFLRATKADACALANGRGLPLYYIVDRFTHAMLEVPARQMEDFIRVFGAEPDSLSTEIPLALGEKVKIVDGELAGVEGEVLALPEGMYVVVTIGHFMCAKVMVPRESVERVL